MLLPSQHESCLTVADRCQLLQQKCLLADFTSDFHDATYVHHASLNHAEVTPCPYDRRHDICFAGGAMKTGSNMQRMHAAKSYLR